MKTLRFALGSVQIAAVIMVLTAAAHTKPTNVGLDRGGLGALAETSTRYLDRESTGALVKLINQR